MNTATTKLLLSVSAALAAAGCHSAPMPAPTTPADTTTPAASAAGAGAKLAGGVERLDPALDALVAPDARPEVLAQGYKWSEGPVWTGGGVLFSDVPNNVVWRWKDGAGASEFLRPSGYTGSAPRGGEPGSNGLAVDSAGRLYLCQHGDRRIARFEAATRTFHTVADKFDGKRFNSPNDLVVRANGDVYFTDPIYGLEGHEKDPARELPFSGVYRVHHNGTVDLVDNQLSFPNGLAFAPDGKTLYVAVSDPARAIWMAYDVDSRGNASNRRVFFDATAAVEGGQEGAARRPQDRRRRQPVRDRPGRRVRVHSRRQAPGHHRHRRADRQLRVRRRRPHAVHDGERQADAHQAEDAGSGRQVTWRRSRRPEAAARRATRACSSGCRGPTRAATTCCWRRWRCWCWGRWAA